MPISKRVLLTGSSGLIGREILEPLLEAGFEVFALVRKQPNICKHDHSKLHWIVCDLFDPEALQDCLAQIKPTHLVHLAWVTTGDYLISNLNFDFLIASLNLLKAFHAHGGKRAVFAGTCFEYQFKESPLKESDPLLPLTVYAQCKHQLQQLASLYCSQNDISFGWGRIFYVYGHGEYPTRLTPSIINTLQSNRQFEINHPALKRDYMYTKDIANAFVAFMLSSVEGAVNIGTGQGITLQSYANTIASLLNKENSIIYPTPLPVDQSPPIIADTTRLKTEVGFLPTYSLEVGLSQVLSEFPL
ncbi:MAG: NAD(P)-dependent oxidoreductase [Vampirovibrio sp.]